MSRSQDTVIDDDEETCPLCIEEFDLSDKNFRPCPCGYQICQFCFNSLKTTYEKSTCPNCRRPYDEKTIQYKIPTAEEFKLDQQNKNKKQAAAKRKETEKREVETSSRRNLAGVRVKQQNLVYVIGLIPQIKDESALLQTLRGPDYFGQYGDIEKIVVSKAKPGAPNQGVGVYVTYARKEDAALCISTVDGSMNGDRILRAQFGTTKYCSAYLRGETCNNKNCSFLHETGEDGQHSSLQNEPHNPKPVARPSSFTPTASIAPPARPLSTTQSVTSSHAMARQSSKEDSNSRHGSVDSSALPSTASWANSGLPASNPRVSNHSADGHTPSPQFTHTNLALQEHEQSSPKDPATTSLPANPKPTVQEPTTTSAHQASSTETKQNARSIDPVQDVFDSVLRSVSSQHFQFVFSDSCLTEDEKAILDYLPVMIDPYGGAKRRVMQDREAVERARLESDAKAKLEAQATFAAEEALEDENMGAGSLALGGEPEDNLRSSSARGTIQRPSQISSSTFVNDHFSNMSLSSRSLTPQQRQQHAQSTSNNPQQSPGVQVPAQNTAFEMSDFERRGPQYSAAQFEQISSHQRNGSRYFNTDSKSSNTNRFQGHQQSFYSSGVQGPPPGLPTAGTPPVSGGGMFAHGQGFTNPGFGASKDSNTEIHMRGRSGTTAGPDVNKRGGEHLADPSIIQSRIHQGGNAGQGLFGGNQVDQGHFPPLPVSIGIPRSAGHSASSSHSLQGTAIRAGTPRTLRAPPGLESTHAHPPALSGADPRADTPESLQRRAPSMASGPVLPAVPLLPIGQRATTPKPRLSDISKSVPGAGSTEEAGEVSSTPNEKGAKAKGAEVSLGSPNPRKADQSQITSSNKEEVASHAMDKADGQQSVMSPALSVELKGKERLLGQKPTKIEIPTGGAVATAKASLPGESTPTSPMFDEPVMSTPPVMVSRPGSPATATSEISRTSIPRARTLRVTTSMTQKPDPMPVSATTERSSVLAGPSVAKSASRPDSISSAPRSRPSTPALSERLYSHDVSRASSPPPSIVGSAPERTKTKNQQKKDRREKAKKSNGNEEVTSTTAVTPATELVAPIVARQKKQKRRVETVPGTKSEPVQTLTRPDIDTNEVAKSPEQLDTKSSVNKSLDINENPAKKQDKPETPKTGTPVASDKDEQPKLPELPTAPYTLRDLYNEVGKMPEDSSDAVQKVLAEHTSSMSKVIASMISSGDLLKDHPWLTPPSFQSTGYRLATDGRKGQEYLDANGYTNTDAFGYVYLPQKEKRALYAGHAVSVADSGDRKNDLLRRCLITPNGWVMRHLSGEESEKVLELEERRAMYAETFGDVGVMADLGVLEEDDFINLGGGIEELGRQGGRHGVCWVVGGDDHGAASEGDGEGNGDGFDDLIDEGGDLLSADDEIDEADDDLDDDENDDHQPVGLDFDGASVMNMPGTWDSATAAARKAAETDGGGGGRRTAAASSTAASSQQRAYSNNNTTLAPLQSQSNSKQKVNLRALDLETLQKRVGEKQKEVEAARKEVEKMEKAFTKKNKDIARWRETVLKV